jgi:hypothetical protein
MAAEAASATIAGAPARRRSRYRRWFPLPDTIPPVAYPAPGENARAHPGSGRQRGDHGDGHLVGRCRSAAIWVSTPAAITSSTAAQTAPAP